MSKRLGQVVAFLLVAALIAPTAASAETASELKARLDDLKSRTAKAGNAYSRAFWRLDETQVRLNKTEKRLKATEKQLAAAKKQLNGRVNGIYRRGNVEFFDLLMGASSFESFATRMDYLQRIGSADARAIRQVKALKARLQKDRKALLAEKRTRTKDTKKLKAERDKLNARLKSLDSEFRQVKARLDAVRSGGRRPSGVAAVAGPNGMVFPVVGSYYYADTWGASRSGGRRRHQGTDIMARRGSPCVAVLSGTVRSKTSSLGGLTIWLTASNGWQFYYAHLDSYAVTSGHVRAGQVIGYVGSTGNARGGSPHLHFEIHPGGGGAVNPYPYLRAME